MAEVKVKKETNLSEPTKAKNRIEALCQQSADQVIQNDMHRAIAELTSGHNFMVLVRFQIAFCILFFLQNQAAVSAPTNQLVNMRQSQIFPAKTEAGQDEDGGGTFIPSRTQGR